MKLSITLASYAAFMLVGLNFVASHVPAVHGQTLDAELKGIAASELVAAARQQGDAARGAVVFFQPQMACAKCHSVGGQAPNQLGPDLAKWDQKITDEALVESVLWPSKVIRKNYESVSLLTTNGAVVTALLVERSPDKVVLRDIARGGELVTYAADDIEQVKVNEQSIMPAGQMNQLNSRQQFLDLLRYLMEIRDGGADRAKQLQPSAALLAFVVPEYESHLDHEGLIGAWNAEALNRGEAIYQRVCANCHGTKDQPGSLPTSLRFAEGKFKNGSDPLSMYRTLTHGFGLMAPQTWMVPSQKYDVIHYIRETYIKSSNASQYVAVDAEYLAKLPKGNTVGPEPGTIETWSAMDYGPSLTHTFEVPGKQNNFAYKGIAIRLDPGAGGVSRGRHWMLFDTDTLRVAAAWSANSDTGTGTPPAKKPADKPAVAKDKTNAKDKNKAASFIDWRGIQFNGEHGIHPRIVGQTAFANSTGPGWANPATGDFRDDQRVRGRDGKRYGPLPREWGKFKGQYHHGQQVILSYSIGETNVLELPRVQIDVGTDASPLFLRTFNIGPRSQELVLQMAEQLSSETSVSSSRHVGIAPASTSVQLQTQTSGPLLLKIAAGQEPLRFTLWQHSNTETDTNNAPIIQDADSDLSALTKGGPARWPQTLTTQIVSGEANGAFALDLLTAPESNPWLAQLRFTGLDFFADGRIAICTWDGDVWIVTASLNANDHALQWRRIATGMFQPLGLKVINDKIHVTCRDQLTVLHDLNGDGEIDFYECLNNDHQVTEHFHEFAMGLQTDAVGNFYYAKSGCHGKAAVVPHHGTLLKVSPDGLHTEILANGFRAANGVCLNPDGSFFVTDQEGFWNPKNRINWVTINSDGKPNFYGNMLGYHDVTDTSDAAMVQPLCWITNEFDRSPAELLWVNSDRWGALNGSLLNLSYGYGKVFLVPHEEVDDKMQGGMIEVPLPAMSTGVMRGRFHPADQQLYLCGMFAWAGNATHPGALYRVRATGQPSYLPIELHATNSGMRLTFTDSIDPASIDVKKLSVKTWSLKRTANYGSKHFDEQFLTVRAATLSDDGKTLTLDVADLQPTWCMEIKYELRAASGAVVSGTVHNTVHALGE